MRRAMLALVMTWPLAAGSAEPEPPKLIGRSGALNLNCSIVLARKPARTPAAVTDRVVAYEWNDGPTSTGKPSIAEIGGRYYALSHVAETFDGSRRLMVGGKEVPVLKMSEAPVGGPAKDRAERSFDFLRRAHDDLVARCPV